MRDWIGKAWDFLIQAVGGLVVIQRWTDYKQWTDFGGSWLSKADVLVVSQRWTDYKQWTDFGGSWSSKADGLVVIQRWIDYKQWTDFGGSWSSKAEYKWQNPYYKFFWWWLRYGRGGRAD